MKQSRAHKGRAQAKGRAAQEVARRQALRGASTMLAVETHRVDTDEIAVETHRVDTREKAVETHRVDTDE